MGHWFQTFKSDLSQHLIVHFQSVAVITAWMVAVGWLWMVLTAANGLPRIPNLLTKRFNLEPEGLPSITVVVPARNESIHVAACLQSLLQQDYGPLRILAVNDRSTDDTGAILDALALTAPERLQVLHIVELPPQWLGKTHAMAVAAQRAIATDAPDFLLFTDADVMYRKDAIRRSLVYAASSGADHLVTVPTTIILRWDEAMVLGFFQIFGLWGARPWKVADPKARRDAIGIGAFNLVRRTAYEQIGGFAGQRMDILEDLTLARRIKRAGLAQRIAFGRGLVNVHWASGAAGLVEVMTKNIFSAFRFHVSLLLLACGWLALFCAVPAAGLLYQPTRLPAALTLLAVYGAYWLFQGTSGISAWNALLSPIASLVLIFTLLRSMVTTLRQGGVIWRGTFYPLGELRKNAAPLFGRDGIL
jgi:glycosyltransferase involved in cell wall biosynthesis